MARRLTLILALSLVTGLLVGCGDDDANPVSGGTSKTESEVVMEALDDYLSSGAGPVMKAEDLFDVLNDGDDTNDPYVLSVRSADHYDIGHVPGAENTPWKTIADAANLTDLPTDRQIVVYCYTGHTGGVATTALNAIGYDAVNMKFGICAWTKDTDVRVATAFTEAADAHDFATETTENVAAASYEVPEIDNTTSSDAGEIVRAAADSYCSGSASAVIKAQDVFDNLNDGDDTNDFVILSVRSADAYALGHIPGAINIPWRTVAQEENLKKLPTGKTIVVYCYTGHTAGVATTALRMLGYDAVNMKWGMVSWTTDTTIRAASPFNEGASADYAFETTVVR